MEAQSPTEPRAEGIVLQSSDQHSMRTEKTRERSQVSPLRSLLIRASRSQQSKQRTHYGLDDIEALSQKGFQHQIKPHKQRIDQGTITQSEGRNRPEGDQETVYTTTELPPGSECITDLCNDIHLRLVHEMQEHTHDQGRLELSKCLPDLIKALALRIGLDKSNPANPYVMHLLHVRSK